MKAWFFDCGTREPGASAGLLVLRLTSGLLMAFGHGWGKIEHFAALKGHWPVPGFLPFLSSPASLIATIICEVGCGVLLALGLLTRWAAFLLGFTMVVAAFGVNGDSPWFIGPGVAQAKEPALLYLLPAVVVILAGAGAYSFDAALYRERKRRYR
jgi:putative oxidoreductase